MKRLEQLPEVAARQLGGLEATSKILAKAKLQAAELRAPRSRLRALHPALAVCAALALCVSAALWVTGDSAGPALPQPTDGNVLTSRAAGGNAVESTAAPLTTGDVPAGSISMSAGAARGQRTLFAQNSDGSFPIVMMEGAAYRMLQSPNAVPEGLLGDVLGTVSEFTVEPALGSGGVVSNVVSCGESVRAVAGRSGAMVAANVNGAMRLFQRVSYAGTAIIGNETLQDTLCSAEDVEWLELSGYGRVADVATAQQLARLLLTNAEYLDTGMSGNGSLMIGLKNGLVLQMLTDEDAVSACGTWICPEFFEAYADLGI